MDPLPAPVWRANAASVLGEYVNAEKVENGTSLALLHGLWKSLKM